MATSQTTTSPAVSHSTSVLAVFLAGLVAVALADWIPHLVNGVLVLILVGVILTSQSKWTPWVNALNISFGGPGAASSAANTVGATLAGALAG